MPAGISRSLEYHKDNGTHVNFEGNEIIHAYRSVTSYCRVNNGAAPAHWPKHHYWAAPENKAEINCPKCLDVLRQQESTSNK